MALGIMCLVGAVRYPGFLTVENLLNVLRQNSMVGIVALGMTLVILTGGIDLSVGSVLAAAGMAAAAASSHGSVVAVGAGLGVGALLGLLNAGLIAGLRIPPFIATLATMIAVRGTVLGLSHEESIPSASNASVLSWIGRGWVGSIPVPVLVLLFGYGIVFLMLRYTAFGRRIYAVGDDVQAARLLGLRVNRVLVATYALSGLAAGVAGVMLVGRLGVAQPVAATGWELDAIAAVVVGGTLLTGGRGGVGRTLVGVLLLAVILNLLNLEGTISPWWQWVIRGLFLLAVVALQMESGKRKRAYAHA